MDKGRLQDDGPRQGLFSQRPFFNLCISICSESYSAGRKPRRKASGRRTASMRISDILTAAGLLTAEGVRTAATHQAQQGGSFCDSLAALGIVSQADLTRIVEYAPATPASVAETGLSERFLLD